jgi:2-polyprenyl-3-methyl-5-hydroxy-6-metoxy-1,4-benzoquinol methylase
MESKATLQREFKKLRDMGLVDARIPDPEHNGNYRFEIESPQEYIRDHIVPSCLEEFPYLIKRANLSPASKILDYGCGWGRLAFAASCFLGSEGSYVGFDINEFAIAENRKCYAAFKNFRFHYIGLDIRENYIYLSENYESASQTKEMPSDRKADEVTLPAEFHGYFDVINTHSVFTHMWKDAIVNVLKQQAQVINHTGVCVNTWLIVDQFARYILNCGLADRRLPYEVDGILTNSRENPLLCTVFKIEDVYEIYQRAGHRILDIEFGSWAGRKNDMTSQDVVVSRPFKNT